MLKARDGLTQFVNAGPQIKSVGCIVSTVGIYSCVQIQFLQSNVNTPVQTGSKFLIAGFPLYAIFCPLSCVLANIV